MIAASGLQGPRKVLQCFPRHLVERMFSLVQSCDGTTHRDYRISPRQDELMTRKALLSVLVLPLTTNSYGEGKIYHP